jgi:glucuronoarabinoxylan endo-1,4-beta-xylanase
MIGLRRRDPTRVKGRDGPTGGHRLPLAAGLILGAVATAAPAKAADAIVRPHQTQQIINGFGASSAWADDDMDDAGADLTFSIDAGVGLSLLRVRIAPDGTCGEVATAQKAVARGANVWATPWSPPPEWKTGTDDAGNGGTLSPMYYGAWASLLVSFVQGMQSQGIPLLGLSAQNEPTTSVTNNGETVGYESCLYTPAALAQFIGQSLGPALSDAGLPDGGVLPMGVIAPETQDWNAFQSFEQEIETDDAGAWNQVGVLASHSYAGTQPSPYPAVADAGKSLWETEVYDETSSNPDPGIGSGLWVARAIHQALVSANANAWHYWWIYPLGPGRGALWDPVSDGGSGFQPTKRLYAMGNYSRFVRPGFLRVAATEVPNPCWGVEVSAYSDPPSGNLVVVAINLDTVAHTQGFAFDGVTTGSWTSWVTSATQSLEPGDAVSDVGSDGGETGRVVYTLAPQSVTTLQMQVTDAGPPLPADSDASACVADAAPPKQGCGLACSTAAVRASGGGGGGLLNGSAAAACAAVAAALGRRATRRRSKRARSAGRARSPDRSAPVGLPRDERRPEPTASVL